jgi:Lar family restriction alleviation protein
MPKGVLKPCPFCGGDNLYAGELANGDFTVECRTMECGCETRIWPSLGEAVAVWNRRVSSTSEQAA